MKFKLLTTLCLALIFSSTSVYADYVDSSNIEHADQNNQAIRSVFIPSGNKVVIYLDETYSIDPDLASDTDNYSIPFVKIKSAFAEKRKLSTDGRNEIDSENYNKITLLTNSALHDKQRFLIITSLGSSSDAGNDLLHSIAQRGTVRTPSYTATTNTDDSQTQADSEASVDTDSNNQFEENTALTYDAITSATAPDASHIRLDFTADTQLDKEQVEDYRTYHLVSQDNVHLYVLKAVMLSPNQIILETQPQTENTRLALTVDWLEDGQLTEWFVYSNAVTSN
jgi:hypothetical protein